MDTQFRLFLNLFLVTSLFSSGAWSKGPTDGEERRSTWTLEVKQQKRKRDLQRRVGVLVRGTEELFGSDISRDDIIHQAFLRRKSAKRHKTHHETSEYVNEEESSVNHSESPPPISKLFSVNEELLFKIFKYLPLTDLLSLRLTSIEFSRVSSDIRLYAPFDEGRCMTHQWIGGPPRCTFENFTFNRLMKAAMRELLLLDPGDFFDRDGSHQAIISAAQDRLAVCKHSLREEAIDERDVLTYLSELLRSCTTSLLLACIDGDRSFIHLPPKPSVLENISLESFRPEWELLKIAYYLYWEGEEDHEEIHIQRSLCDSPPGHLGLLDRHLEARLIRENSLNVNDPLLERLLNISIRSDKDTSDIIAVAAAYFQRRNYTRSTEFYDEALRKAPNSNAWIYASAAYSHLRNQNFSRAAELYEVALEKDPNLSSGVYANAAFSHMENNNFPRATELYDEASRRDQNLPAWIYANAGTSHLRNQNFSRAAELYDEALRRDPELSAVRYANAAQAHMENKNFGRATELYDEALRRDQNLPAWRYANAAFSHMENNNFPRATELYDEALRRDQNLPAWRYANAGTSHLRNQNFSRAAELYDEALRRNPELSAVRYANAAQAHMENKNFPRATELYDEALRRDQNSPPWRYANAARAHMDNNNFPRATELYDEALRRDQNLPAWRYTNAGTAHLRNQSFSRAAELYDEALRRDTELSIVRYTNTARAHMENKNFPRAAELYDEALRRDPNLSAWIYANTAFSHMENKNVPRATELYDEALRRDQNLPAWRYANAARAHMENKNFSRAAELYDEALRRDQNLPVWKYANAGNAHLRNQNFSRAAELYDEVLRRDQNSPAWIYDNAAFSHQGNKNFSRAADLFDEACRKDPNLSLSRLICTACCHFLSGNIDKGKQLIIQNLSEEDKPLLESIFDGTRNEIIQRLDALREKPYSPASSLSQTVYITSIVLYEAFGNKDTAEAVRKQMKNPHRGM